jgi:hypothetical protein
MRDNGHDPVGKLHREGVEHQREHKTRQRALVEAMFREAVERRRRQEPPDPALAESVRQEGAGHTEARFLRIRGINYPWPICGSR